jgi:hypothetical protein
MFSVREFGHQFQLKMVFSLCAAIRMNASAVCNESLADRFGAAIYETCRLRWIQPKQFSQEKKKAFESSLQNYA